jgi:hypothetical protein
MQKGHYKDNGHKYKETRRKAVNRFTEKHPEKASERSRKHKGKIRIMKEVIKMANGCLNPDCKWEGAYCESMLEFHHIDKKLKNFDIGRVSYTIEKLLEEIRKCTVVCANCHRLIHYNQIDASTFKPIDLGKFTMR